MLQAGTVTERFSSDGGDRVGDGYACYIFTVTKCPLANVGDPIRDVQAGQACAVIKGIVTDGCDRITDGDVCQTAAAKESSPADGVN